LASLEYQDPQRLWVEIHPSLSRIVPLSTHAAMRHAKKGVFQA
jgi:hypothetical protein